MDNGYITLGFFRISIISETDTDGGSMEPVISV